jgi:hypothetical protein
MTVANYNSLVQKTFCENAIRSVVMIDDDFLTYSESIRALNNEVDLDYNKIDSSKRAATLESFFQSKNMFLMLTMVLLISMWIGLENQILLL